MPVWSLPAVAAADPALRPSEQLDLRRLGKVSNDERAVLRVEWHAATSGSEEARSMQEMLDSLRRMERTVGEIGRLMHSAPAQKPAAAISAMEAPLPEIDSKQLALGAGAAAALLALFWAARRKTREIPDAAASVGAAALTDVMPAGAEPPAPPEPVPMAEAAMARSIEPDRAAAAPMPHPGARDTLNDAPPGQAAAVALAGILPPSPPEPEHPQTPPADEARGETANRAEISAIEFTLEEADPAALARASAASLRPTASGSMNGSVPAAESTVEPTLELAEIMLSMGLEQSAAQALVEYSEAHPRQALYHWLKLLAIYRGSGHRKDFKETAEKLRQHFNIQAEDWAGTGTGAAPTLEDFARVAGHVQEIWRQPEDCMAYLQHLLEDNRDGERAGFPQAVAEEILLLIEILKLTSAAQAGET